MKDKYTDKSLKKKKQTLEGQIYKKKKKSALTAQLTSHLRVSVSVTIANPNVWLFFF